MQCIGRHILAYINDLPNGEHNMVKLFADDAKIYAIVNRKYDASVVQRDLHNIDGNDWSDKWDVKFNNHNCSHMHLGIEHCVATYFINNNGELTEINNVTEQRYF